MNKPLAKYDDLDKNLEPEYTWDKVVYAAILDKRYKVEVQRLELPQKGKLLVFDGKDNDKQIFEEETVISFGAQFGPDYMDVNVWQEKACNAVDNLNKK